MNEPQEQIDELILLYALSLCHFPASTAGGKCPKIESVCPSIAKSVCCANVANWSVGRHISMSTTR